MSHDFVIDCDENNPYVQKQIRWYQQHPKHLAKVLKGAEPFIHYVFEQTHRKNLPAELALIPIIESQYNPSIGARSGAAGLWQMMPGTAKKFGLKINHSYDGRRDVTASTKAALTYLSYLHRYFNNDWLLALAAYECGEGNVQAIARRNHPFWELPLSRATKEYVPKLIAIAYIIKNPDYYHVRLPWMADHGRLQEKVWNEADVINVSDAARSMGVDDHTLKQYNPGIRSQVATVPHSLTLLVPDSAPCGLSQETSGNNDSPETAANEEKALPVEETLLDKPQRILTYHVKKHDTLASIAKRFNLSTIQLQKANHLTSSRLKIGKTLEIPALETATQQAPTVIKNPVALKTRSKKYTIHQGDSLSTIAHKFHVSIKQLQRTNHFTNEKHLKIGQSVTIPAK